MTDTDLRGWFRPGGEDGSTRRDPAERRDAADSSHGGYGITNVGPATGDVAHDMPLGQLPYGQVGPPSALGPHGQNGASNGGGFVETGDVLPALGEYHPLPESASMEDISRLYGQIAIYTLLDETAEDFERLASEVVEQVKTREPDTLVYVMHGVPAAPMQRILYAIYRDEAAFDRHERQPYIRQFEEEREPYVLADQRDRTGRTARQVHAAHRTAPAARAKGQAARQHCPVTTAAPGVAAPRAPHGGQRAG